jgi:hypothetical protein
VGSLDDVLASDVRWRFEDRADIYDCVVNFVVQADTLALQMDT